MKKKVSAVLAIIFLAGIIILTQRTGDFIFERVQKNSEKKMEGEMESEEQTELKEEKESKQETKGMDNKESEERNSGTVENKSESVMETTGNAGKKEKQGKNKKTIEGVVVIDAGHGGKDPGKVGINDAIESKINLKISKKLKKYLEEKGVTVVMTRENEDRLADSQVEDLKTRVSLINKTKPKLAVCIHQNSYPDSQVSGVQVFYYTHSKEGQTAAKLIQDAFSEKGSERVRESKANDSYYILKHTEVPTLIVECGFLSNQKEADKLITDDYQEEVARIIAEGIQNYLE